MISSYLSEVPVRNGHVLSASYFRPDGEAKASVLIVPAMGVHQRYYATLAAWLAAQGYFVATFDYFGTGLSCSADVRQVNVNIVDWASFDCDAMVDAIFTQLPGKPLYWVGHSLGAQILSFVPDLERIAKMVSIAAGSGYWWENAPRLKWRAWWLWYVAAPLATRLFGYFPGKRLRKVGDLPRGVMDQWRRWCTHPEYAIGAEGTQVRTRFAAVRMPITSISFVDDEMMSIRNTESLHKFYSSAPITMKRISPRDIEAKRIGHFGFFNARFEKSLWETYLLPELT